MAYILTVDFVSVNGAVFTDEMTLKGEDDDEVGNGN